jgi:hypothetical protein
VYNKLEGPSTSKTISEKVYFERLQKNIGKDKTDEFQQFVQNLTSDLNIYPKLGRGKRLSLNLKSSNDTYNFASIQEDGEVWFYGIITKTEEIGDKQIGLHYLKELARIVKGEFIDDFKEWNWCVKKNGKYLNVLNYLSITVEWKELISVTLEKINSLEENN